MLLQDEGCKHFLNSGNMAMCCFFTHFYSLFFYSLAFSHPRKADDVNQGSTSNTQENLDSTFGYMVQLLGCPVCSQELDSVIISILYHCKFLPLTCYKSAFLSQHGLATGRGTG